jgi:predicted nucleic acid-binding protein
MMVDSNVIIDIITRDKKWYSWSAEMVAKYCEKYKLFINPVIFGEVSVNFSKIEDLKEVLPEDYFEYLPIPPEAAFLAAKVFFQYRRNRGNKRSTLPDFFIGAHAAVLNMPLLTRDPARYKTYFPRVKLILPAE